MSCSFRIFLMGLEREGWKCRKVLREGFGLVCLLNEAMDWKVEGLLNFCETSVMMEVMREGGNPFWRRVCRMV